MGGYILWKVLGQRETFHESIVSESSSGIGVSADAIISIDTTNNMFFNRKFELWDRLMH